MSVICIWFPNKPKLLLEFAETCERWTPRLCLVTPPRGSQALYLDLRGTAHFFNRIQAEIQILAQRFDLSPHIGQSSATHHSPPSPTSQPLTHVDPAGSSLMKSTREAYLAACTGVSPLREASLLTRETFSDWLFPLGFPSDSIKRLCIDLGITLERLGFVKLHSVTELSVTQVQSLLGKTRFACLIPYFFQETPWSLLRFESPIEAILDATDSQTLSGSIHQDQILFCCKSGLDQISARLRGRGLRAAVLHVELRGPDLLRTWNLNFPFPLGGTSSFLRILRERLAHDLQTHPLYLPETMGAGVSQIQLLVTRTTPGKCHQRDFFSHDVDPDQWAELINRLSSELGLEQVFTAIPHSEHTPELSWKKQFPHTLLPLAPDPFGFPDRDRPNRLLKKPVPIRKIEDWIQILIPPHPRWKIETWSSPERIHGHSWSQAAQWIREYYQVCAESGERLWIFKDESDRFYLHGYFD